MGNKYDRLSVELKKLSAKNPDQSFRIRRCEHTDKQVIQIKEDADNWLCLHEMEAN